MRNWYQQAQKKAEPKPCLSCYSVMPSQIIVGVRHELVGVQYDSSHDSQPSNKLINMKAMKKPVSARAIKAPAVCAMRFT